MLFLCLDSFNQEAFLNYFIEVSSETILLAQQIFSVMGCGIGWQRETASGKKQRSLLAGFGWDHFCTLGTDRTTTFSFIFAVCLFT